MLEIEDKYDVPDGFELPELHGLPGVADVTAPYVDQLEATYFDTDDLRLARGKVTLRRRSGGADEGWHLKLPAGTAREEISRPLGRSRQVPPELRDLVFGRTRGARLVPVTVLRTRRTTRELRAADGTLLATVVDDDVQAEPVPPPGTSGPAAPRSWREVEVELAAGDRELLRKIAPRLQAAGAKPSQRPSKLATALGDRLAGAPPLLPPFARRVRRRSAAGEVVRSYLAKQLDRMLEAELRVRLDEEEGIHDMRVATRRLRSTMSTFAPLLDAPRAAELAGRLKDLAAELGVVRDAQVLLGRLLSELERVPEELVLGPVRDRLTQALSAVVADGRQSLLATMTSRAYAALVDDLIEFVASGVAENGPAARKAKAVLPPLVARRYRKLARRAKRSRRLSGGDQAHALHDTRKAAKRARYAAEAVADAFGAAATAFAEQAEAVQEVLGEHQDSVVAAQRLRQLAIAANATHHESAFTFGVLAGAEQVRAAAAREAFDGIWKTASQKRYRKWLKS